jgi:hypothetical protein
MQFAVGKCPHGTISVALNLDRVAEDEKRDLAACYDVALVDTVTMNGGCAICHERYEANCKLLGIEP